MPCMDLRVRFEEWVEAEIGSKAPPAVLQYIVDRGYRPLSVVEDDAWQRDVYHPDQGVFTAVARDDRGALLDILRQIWLVDSIQPAPGSEVGPASDR